MVTFDDVRLRCDVFVRYNRHKCMRMSVLQSDLRGYSCTNTMMEKLKNIKASTTFQILCVYFKQISVKKKITPYCQLLENIDFAFRLT